jgi:N-glycosyltransferase
MRILFSCHNIPTHLGALLPVIRAARRAGHTVAVAAPRDLAARLAEHGLEHVVAGREWLTPLVTALARRTRLTPLWLTRAGLPLITARMAGEPAVSCARDILAAGWTPDLIVRECMEFGGVLAAERLGVPSACVGTAGYVPEAFPPGRMARIFAASRAAAGLPKDPDGFSAYPFYAALMPRQFDPLVGRIPNAHHYQDNELVDDAGHAPQWPDAPAHDRLLVYACLGSSALAYGDLAQRAIRRMEVMVSALDRLDCAAIVSTGGWVAPEHLGRQPGRVRVVAHAPQRSLLGRADLFVTHAGYTSVRESVRAGTPMVTIPLAGDQPYTARRAVERGIARNVSGRNLTVQGIRRACVKVLAVPDYRRHVEDLRRQTLALPDLDALVKDLATWADRT